MQYSAILHFIGDPVVVIALKVAGAGESSGKRWAWEETFGGYYH